MDESLRKIWWLASFPKSGSTWVRLFLNAYVSGLPTDINAAQQYVALDQQVNLYHHVSARPVADCHPVELAYLRPAMLMHHVQMVAPRDACLKTHCARVELDGIPWIPPRLTKQAVYLVRDPRDVALSYARHCDRSVDEVIDLMASQDHQGIRPGAVRDNIMSWSTNVDSWSRCTAFPVTVVRYEDLRREPAVQFRRILEGLGFRKLREGRLEFALSQTNLEGLQEQEAIAGFRERRGSAPFFHSGAVGGWEESLTVAQVARIEENHVHAMSRMGYNAREISQDLEGPHGDEHSHLERGGDRGL